MSHSSDNMDLAGLLDRVFEPVAWRWRAKVKGEWGLWSVVEVDPNDWTWRDYWDDLEVEPLFSLTYLKAST